MEWKITNIGSLCNRVCSGGTPKSTNNAYYNGNIPWLNTKEVNFNRIYDTEKKITQLGLENSSAKWISENSVIVAMYGATAGKVAITKIPITTNQACCNLSINTEIADYNFVYYFLCSKFYELSSLANGGAQQNLNAQIIKDFPIKIPVNLSDQRKIAGILSALDSKIENNNKINANLEAQAQALFKSWFVDFTPFKDQPFVDSELGPIPQGWKVEKINDLDLYITDFVSNGSFASLKQNVTLYSDKNYAFFIRNTDLKEGRFRAYVDKSSYFFLKKSVLYGGEIIISNVGDVGSVNLCPKLNKPMTLGNNIIMLKSEDEATHNFLYILFKWSYGKSLIKSITGGSAQPKFNKGDFKSLKIIMPPGKKLSDFNLIASSLLKQIEEFKEENQRLAALRDTLLPKLMSGEIKL